MLADIGSLGDGGLAGFQRNRRVHRIVRDLKIGDRLLAAVVGDGVRFAFDLDDNLRRVLRDGQRTLYIGDVVVVGDGLVVGVLDDRIGRNVFTAADIRLAAGHGDALNGVAFCQLRAGVGVLRQRRAVVGLASGTCRDFQRLRPDGQFAVHTGDAVVLRKRVVLQLVSGDFVGTVADIRPAAGNRHIRETFLAHELALGDLVARRRQRLAVVGLVGGIRRQLDRDRRNGQRADLMRAKVVVRGHICSGRLVFHAVGLKLVGHGPDVALSMIGSEGYDQLVALCQRTGVVASSIPQQIPVVRSRPGRRGDDDDIRALRDGERAGAYRDGIVAFNKAVVLRVFDGVLDHAVLVRTVGHVGDAAGGGDAGDFTRHKAVAAHSDGRAGQRRPVVGLGRRIGGQDDGALRDGQRLRTGDIAGVVRAGSADLNGLALGNVLRGDRRRVGRPSLAVVRAVLNGDLAAVFVGRARRSGGVGLAVVHVHNIRRVQRDVLVDLAGRVDLQPAVGVRDLDVAVVLGRRREVRRFQTHHVLTGVSSLGDGGLVRVQRNLRVRGVIRDLKIGDRLLFAVVGDGVRVAHNGDRDLLVGLRDGQRAGLEDNIVIGGDFSGVDRSVFVYDLEFVDIVRGAAGIGDGTLFGHGDGEVILRIAVDETLGGKRAAGEGSAVIHLAVRACRKGQGRPVPNANDVLRLVLDNRLFDVELFDRQLAIECRIEHRALAVVFTQRRADGLAAGLVVGDPCGRSGEIVVDGVLRGVELEVYLQYERAVRFDLTGEDVSFVGLVKDVTVFLRALIFKRGCDSCAGRAGAHLVRSGRFLSKAAVGLLVVILNGILRVRSRRPLGIEDVRPDLVHTGVGSARKGRAGAALLGVPAGEDIAGAGEARLLHRQQLDQTVAENAADFSGGVVFVVRVIGQLDRIFNVAPDGVERNVAGDPNFIVGLIFGVAGRRSRPAEEYLVRGRGKPERRNAHHVGICVNGVYLGVGSFFRRAVLIGHGIAVRVGEVRIEFNVAKDLSGEVERGALCGVGRPTGKHPAVAFRRCRLGKIARADGPAVGDGELRSAVASVFGDVDRAGKLGSRPLGVHVHAAQRHGFGREVNRLAGAGAVIVPAGELERIRYARRSLRRVRLSAQALRILQSDGMFGGRVVAVVEVEIVALEQVVQIKFIVTETLLIFVVESCRACRIAVVALNLVILLGIGSICKICLYLFQQRKVCAARGPAAARHRGAGRLYIIIDDFLRIAAFIVQIKGRVEAGHTVQRLQGVVIVRSIRAFPRSACIGGAERRFGELVGDLLIVFRLNGGYGGLASFKAPPIIFHNLECQRIPVPGEVDVDDSGAVARDGHALELFICIRAVVFKIASVGGRQIADVDLAVGQRDGRPGGPGGGFRLDERVAVVIGIFFPVDQRVGGVRSRLPVCGERNVRRQLVAERERGAVLVEPALERVAGLRRGGGRGGHSVRVVEHGRNVRAAVGVIVDPVTLFLLGVHGDVLIGQRDGVGGVLIGFIIEPAGDRKLGACQRIGHAGGIDLVARHALHGMDNATGRIDEEHIQHGRELRIRPDGPRLGDAGHRAERNGIAGAVFLCVPAGELVAVPLRGGGAEERFVILDDLLGDHFLAYVKFVGAVFVLVLVGQDHRERNAVLPVLGVLLVVGGFVLGFFSFGGLLRAGGLFALGGRFAVLGFFSFGGLLRAGGLFALGGRFAVLGFFALDRRGGFVAFAVLGGRLLLRGG